jgi:flagellar hook-basal body complex protein FliE
MNKDEYNDIYEMRMEKEHEQTLLQMQGFNSVLSEMFQSPTEMYIPAEHYNELTVNQDEDLHRVLDSVQDAINTLTALKKTILAGKLSQQEAELWHDDIIKNAGMDFLSALEQYAWSDQ